MGLCLGTFQSNGVGDCKGTLHGDFAPSIAGDAHEKFAWGKHRMQHGVIACGIERDFAQGNAKGRHKGTWHGTF